MSQYHRRQSQRFAVVKQSASIVAPAVHPRVDKDSRHIVDNSKGVMDAPAVYPRVGKDCRNFVKPFMRGYLQGVVVTPAVWA